MIDSIKCKNPLLKFISPLIYFTPPIQMPHESTVGHEDVLPPHHEILASRSRLDNDVMSPVFPSPDASKKHPLERLESVGEPVRR